MDRVNKPQDLLRLLVAQYDNGLEEYVYPRLQVGDVWWIPDVTTGLQSRKKKEKHPCVVVRGHSYTRSTVVVSLRTTSFDPTNPKPGIITPANVIPGLDKQGLILKGFRKTMNADDFQNYDYIDRLPDEWIERLKQQF